MAENNLGGTNEIEIGDCCTDVRRTDTQVLQSFDHRLYVSPCPYTEHVFQNDLDLRAKNVVATDGINCKVDSPSTTNICNGAPSASSLYF